MNQSLTIIMTGGHLTPALATAQAVFELQPGARIIYLAETVRNPAGSPEIVETSRLGIQVLNLTSGKWHRFLTFGNLVEICKLPLGIFQAVKILSQVHPAAVVSFGGFLALPVAIAAKILAVPLVIHEQTPTWGIANRLSLGWAKTLAVSWPNLGTRAGDQELKVEFTGIPLRQEVLSIIRAEDKHRPVLYITGGHQGSTAIDAAISPLLPGLVTKFEVYHQTKTPPSLNSRYYHRASWYPTEKHAQILSRTTLAVSRAGANTVAELAYLGIPAILVPLPISAAGEQIQNARILAGTALAKVIEQSDLTPSSLQDGINLWMAASSRQRNLAAARAGKLVNPLASRLLAKIIIEAANG